MLALFAWGLFLIWLVILELTRGRNFFVKLVLFIGFSLGIILTILAVVSFVFSL